MAEMPKYLEVRFDAKAFKGELIPIYEDMAPVQHGHWIKIIKKQFTHEIPVFDCSLCGRRVILGTENYCPECGAKMDEEADNVEDT